MLTQQQLATLGAYIAADPVLSAYPNTGDGNNRMADVLNAPASPAFYVWRSQYTSDQMRAAIVNGVTQLDALTASKRDSLLWLSQGAVDATLAATRAAFDDLTGSQQTLKAAVLDGAKRKASLVEKVLATGTGSLAAPAVAGFEGAVSYLDIQDARA